MALKFNSDVTILDLVGITGGAVALYAAVAINGQRIEQNTLDIARSQDEYRREIDRIAEGANADRQEILDALDDQKEEVRAIRTESLEGRLRIERKLDSLIQRQIPE